MTLHAAAALNVSNHHHMECEAKARGKLIDWRFDPDDVSKGTRSWYHSQAHLIQDLAESNAIGYGERDSRPMVLFSQIGDLPMMRYIWQNSPNPCGELCKTDEFGLFPLYTAISDSLDEDSVITICQWLHGKCADLKQTVANEWSPLSKACLMGFGKLARWLLSNGVLLDAGGSFDVNLAKRDLPSTDYDPVDTVRTDPIHRDIFAWAENINATRNKVLLLLMGTLPRQSFTDHRTAIERSMTRQYHSSAAVSFLLRNLPHAKLAQFMEMTASPLRIFSGHPGVMQHIAQYAGIETSRAILCTTRGLVEHKIWWDRKEESFGIALPHLEQDVLVEVDSEEPEDNTSDPIRSCTLLLPLHPI